MKSQIPTFEEAMEMVEKDRHCVYGDSLATDRCADPRCSASLCSSCGYRLDDGTKLCNECFQQYYYKHNL